jgi:hypothetical protein
VTSSPTLVAHDHDGGVCGWKATLVHRVGLVLEARVDHPRRMKVDHISATLNWASMRGSNVMCAACHSYHFGVPWGSVSACLGYVRYALGLAVHHIGHDPRLRDLGGDAINISPRMSLIS